MEDNAVEQDQIDFSIISPQNHKPKQIDFSVHQLLTEPRNTSNTQQNKNESASIEQQAQQPQGSFMKDLQKMEKQISYETIPYDIYEPTQQFAQYTANMETKQQDTYTKTTNNVTNLTKLCDKNIETDFKHLIIDFTQDKCYKLNIKQSFDDYLQEQILTTKMVHEKKHEKQISSRSLKTSQTLVKNTNSRSKIISTISKEQVKERSKKKITQVSSKKSVDSNISKRTSSKSLKKLPIKPIKNNQTKQPTTSKSRQKQKNKIFESSVTKLKTNKQKNFTRLQSQVYSQYYGFDKQIKTQNKHNDKKSTSKGKKIVFMNKNINLKN